MSDEHSPSLPLEPGSRRDIKLTAEQQSEITDHINRKSVDPNDACPVCGSPSNIVIEEVYRIPVLKDLDSLGGRFQPLVSTCCLDCGYVRFFNRNVVENLIKDHHNKSKVNDADL